MTNPLDNSPLRSVFVALMLLSLPLASSASATVPDTLDLSLGDAIALAFRESPAKTQADVTRASGTLTLVRGIADLLPTAAVSADWSSSDTTSPWTAAFTVNQVIFSPSTFFGVASAAVRSGYQSLGARDARARLLYDATVDYLDLLRAGKLRDVAAAGLGRATAYLDLVTEQRRLGMVSAVDLLRARVQESQARINLLSAENDLAVSVEGFKATAGLGRSVVVRATDSLERPSGFSVGDPDSLVAEIERRNPTARLARKSGAMAGLGLAATVSGILPDVSYNWQSGYSGDKLPSSVTEWKDHSTQNSGVRAGITINPKSYILDAADAVLETKSTRAARRAADLQVRASAVTAVRNYGEARARYDLAEATLRLNEQLHELAGEELRLGTISRVDYLDVEADLVSAQSSWVDGVCDTYVQAAQIAYLLGDASPD